MNCPFNYPESRFETAKSNNFFCELAGDELPEFVTNALKEISDYPVVKVPIRKRGITSAQELHCFWNVNVISQTFGGKPMNGWIIELHESDLEGTGTRSTHARLIGHSVWCTPEGKLVDCTRPNDTESPDLKFRYFLPSDVIQKLNKTRETMKCLSIPSNVYEVKRFIEESAYKFKYGYSNFLAERNNERCPMDFNNCAYDDALYIETVDLEKYVNKVIDPFAYPLRIRGMDTFLKKFGFNEETIKNVLKPFVGVVDKDYPKLEKYGGGISFEHKAIHACKRNHNIFENHFNELAIVDAFVNKRDETKLCLGDNSVVGISTANGKSIFEIPPKLELISNHQLPRKKSKRRKIERIASKTALSSNELLMLNNDYLYPHPHLLKKTNFERIAV